MSELISLNDNKLAVNDAELARDLLRRVKEIVIARNGNHDLEPENVASQMAMEAVRQCEILRRSYRAVQAMVVAKAAREQMWLHHPATQEYPEGIGSLKEFLLAAGIPKGSSVLYDLAAIGEEIVPYCDGLGIVIEESFSDYSRFQEVIPTLRGLGKADAPKQDVLDVLSDVRSATTRDALRSKYREKRADSVARATVVGDLFIVKVNGDAARDAVYHRLTGHVDWNLLAVGTERDGSIYVTVSMVD